MFLRNQAKLLIAHYTAEDLVVTFHSLNEKIIEDSAEEGGEVCEVVSSRRLNNRLVALGRSAYLIKEKLIGVREVSAKPLASSNLS